MKNKNTKKRMIYIYIQKPPPLGIPTMIKIKPETKNKNKEKKIEPFESDFEPEHRERARHRLALDDRRGTTLDTPFALPSSVTARE